MGTRTSDGSEIPLNLDKEQLELLRKALQKYNDAQEVMSIYKEEDSYYEELTADEFKVGDMVEKQKDLEREKELYRLKSLEEDRRIEEEKQRLMREVAELKKAERERIAKEERDRDECEAREDWGLF